LKTSSIILLVLHALGVSQSREGVVMKHQHEEPQGGPHEV